MSSMNVIVQVFVWTMLAGLMYLAWQHSQATSSGHPVNFGLHLGKVLNLFQSIWFGLGLLLIILVMYFLLPRLAAYEDQAGSTCISAAYPVVTLADTSAFRCGDPTPAAAPGKSHSDAGGSAPRYLLPITRRWSTFANVSQPPGPQTVSVTEHIC